MKDKPGEACVVADQSTNEDGTAVKTPLEEWQWKAIEAGDYALLRKYDTGTTNVDQKSDTYGTPLVTLIDKFIFKSPNNEKEKYLNCIRWLIKRGANPLTTTPGSCTLQISYQKRDNENDKTKRVLVSKKNAIQILYDIKDSLPSTAAWQQERERCRALVSLLAEPVGKEDNGPKVLLDKKVISFWESLMLSEDTPDITVTCANGTAKVHSCVLRASSKTFDAMFKHDMMEKRTMTIDLSHLQIEDFKMFRSLLYTGCLEKEPTDDELLDLFELADQYQVQHLCEVLAGHIHNRLSPQNFDKFCHFAITHCSELLKLPCCIYAASNEAVKAQFNGGKLSEPVTEELTKFFGIEVHPSKRRRFSL